MPIDLSAIGKKLGSVTHTYSERDVMLYALGVGCGTDDLQFDYERDLKVLPTFAVVPSFPAMLNLGGAMQVNPAMVPGGKGAAPMVVVRKVEAAELDEMWSFVGRKQHPRWLWGALNHQTGRILAYVFGRREDRALLKLKALLKPFGIRRY